MENNTQRLDSITPVVDLLADDDIKYYQNGGVYNDDNINWIVYDIYINNMSHMVLGIVIIAINSYGIFRYFKNKRCIKQ